MIKNFLGILMLFIGIGLLIKLIPNISSLINSFSNAVNTNLNSDWGSFTAELVITIVLGVVDYFILKFGLKLYRSN
ncbi:hypothetical protein PK35_05320 [Tamlana nanhaiensis]|uniref:Uncharacterized protein n=1 Tax=Neotamlana nanhaiensis TaxID=1382798 RepID=A0A0D7W4U6_9FLAO|nr:hypothetical protein [Tamlana nanhaiensis]KJD34146.1 hypothetical protein PK35_05320 [Tamlana nanhaiensis]